MTETKKKALALLNEVAKEMGLEKVSSLELDMPGERALLRALEQHEAFRREVSDAVEELAVCVYEDSSSIVRRYMGRFIIPQPDPLVEVLSDIGTIDPNGAAKDLRAALAARGLEIVKKEPSQ